MRLRLASAGFLLVTLAIHPAVRAACDTTSTTVTSTSSSTMIDRCCVGDVCMRLNPPGCVQFGGVPIGDGSCDPNPCATTTTTTLP